MNQSLGRRAATAAGLLAATLGALLLAGGSASAAQAPAAHHGAAVSPSPVAFQVRDHQGDRYDWYSDGYAGRYDGYRLWERQGSYWYSNDHDRRYRYDGHQFYLWDNGWRIVETIDVYGFNPHIFR
ncbi:hypothetical protein [Kitasatospora sp. HPMI-4]|uniref:hypothetical protein n=1 Tax=Kitasatospora sp. HPMI-4 TaxID=3448443 RepID=UPI003F1B6AE4